MVAGRRYNPGSALRYYLKILRRFNAIANSPSDVTRSGVNVIDGVVQTSVVVTKNWVNGFVPYSEIRYKVLEILDKYKISRAMALPFMASAQHMYKECTVKSLRDSDPDSVFARELNNLIGATGYMSYPIGTITNALADIAKMVGCPGSPGAVIQTT